jgi:hypothetical protein
MTGFGDIEPERGQLLGGGIGCPTILKVFPPSRDTAKPRLE